MEGGSWVGGVCMRLMVRDVVEGRGGRVMAAVVACRKTLGAVGACVVLQLDTREEDDEPALEHLELLDARRYGNVALRFYSVA